MRPPLLPRKIRLANGASVWQHECTIRFMFTGTYTAIVTPFKNGKLDEPALARLVKNQIKGGVDGIVPVGTTGESPTVDYDEHVRIIELAVQFAAGKIKVLAGTGANSTTEAIFLTKAAEHVGADGSLQVAPYYNKPTPEGLYQHFRAIANETKLPIVLYSIPGRCGIEIGVDTVKRLAASCKNIVGIKESSGDFSRALALIQARLPDFEVICGCDDQAADFLFWGVRSWISGAANVFPGEQVAMLNAAKAEDWARVRTLMAAMYPAIQAMESGGYNQKAKLGVRRHGVDAGDVRLPLLPLPGAEAKSFLDALAAFDR
jgi:4-hydroxy-tetrahydrodipicolinate synthase